VGISRLDECLKPGITALFWVGPMAAAVLLQTELVLDGVLETFIRLLCDTSIQVQEQAAAALAQLAQSNVAIADYIVQLGVLPVLKALMPKPERPKPGTQPKKEPEPEKKPEKDWEFNKKPQEVKDSLFHNVFDIAQKDKENSQENLVEEEPFGVPREPLTLPQECAKTEALMEAVLRTLGSCMHLPAARQELLLPVEEEVPWPKILLKVLKPKPPPPPPPPEPKPEDEEGTDQDGSKGGSRGGSKGKDRGDSQKGKRGKSPEKGAKGKGGGGTKPNTPGTPSTPAPKAPSNILPADDDFFCNTVYCGALKILQALLQEPEFRDMLCGIHGSVDLSDILKVIQGGDIPVIECGTKLIIDLMAQGGEQAKGALYAAGVKEALRKLSTHTITVPNGQPLILSNVISSLAGALLCFPEEELLPPHRPATPPPTPPPPPPPLPSWRDTPLRKIVLPEPPQPPPPEPEPEPEPETKGKKKK
ncbi:hypothetical protein CYMTET_2818, partial [Cymbomonas tetramitiformis]